MVVCICRNIKESDYDTPEDLAKRVLEDDHCCGCCLEEFLSDGGEPGSTWTKYERRD